MIKEVQNLKNTELLFKEYFPTYKCGDIYEYVAIYEENEIKAMISYSIIYERIEINYIVTITQYRHQGLAEKLLDYIITKALNLKCHNISLEVSISNIAAINLYLKKGFKKRALRENYYNGEDAYLMVKELVVI